MPLKNVFSVRLCILSAPLSPAAPVMRTRVGAAISWREKEEGERKKGAGKTKGVKKKMKSLLCFLGRSTKNTVDDSLSFFFRFARSLSLSSFHAFRIIINRI